ncbi:hypothetical protein A2926_03505 [Candidatus Giovannonibacteria bacterium RIFCSPLOWO2_01_FULL_44_40]|uniref:Capsule polysaccharide biosynthesis protein n=1 Tax=Candidatus Giovannonibacteria bacterium RIFCSPHIGHO2_01_FULL_45_23 TaxID=1798325 RepID=A0A1F5VHU0_9BACT|nr:MAG: hypothetical protein A2834_03480 [Candidatus Giovannonibacteria bacterium RIFCSPHIGHO2_01_FULL_45_23]OGF75701.1 MAG: hypothetical protein A3C77_01760 [Candidatus Giovannonibacteria bacterium RIFCSPHIGHO2_02_FULL_45_13]OGF79827.1 MAG: hypothetical protein A2926_03505 [Candidatus Giovannonibacteria bacterium RIFCSPLOWO2_01_FULL_44_40]
MKIFLIWTDKSAEMNDLIAEFKKRGHEIVYWIGYEGMDKFKAPETIFHSYREALAAKPARGVDVSGFSPPGANLLQKLHRTESLVLTMLNRFMDKASVDERKHFYYQMVRYWHGVLKKYRPDAVVMSYIPHFVYDFVIYALAETLGIKILTFVDTRIPGRLLPLKDFWGGSEWLHDALEENRDKNFKAEDLPEDIKNYYAPRTDKNFNSPPPNLDFKINKYSTRFSLFNFFYLFTNNLKGQYLRLQSPPDFSKKFIYAPLQLQPECSTSPQGGAFVDQILALEILSAALPAGWLIYVKEHPLQWMRWGFGFSSIRYRDYYKKISEIDNVSIVPLETSSYKLINESQAVATVTGAPGWEAVLRSKPAIVFGYPWYYDCPGLLHVKDFDSCREAVEKIKNGFKIDHRPIINYLKSFGEAAIRGYIAPSAGAGSGLSNADSVKNIAAFIINELPKL